MKKLLFAVMAAASLTPATLYAQDSSSSKIEPYVGVMSGWDDFDSHPSKAGIPPVGYDGWLVEGVAGVNYNIAGPFVVGVEGNVAKGINGDVDWEYGVAGRAGVKAGKDSLIFGKMGYLWTNFAALGKNSPDYHGSTYGIGAELSPVDFGMGSGEKSNVRLRLQVDTLGNFTSYRPMAGIVAKF